MPYLPPTAHPSLLTCTPTEDLMSWIDAGEVPSQAPHHHVPTQYGCTINQDFDISSTRTRLIQGIQGHVIEWRDDKIKVHIAGITGHPVNGIWVDNEWVPASIVNIGQLWKPDIKDWPIQMDFGNWKPPTTGLFIRHDTHVKSRSDGSVFPMAIIREDQPRIAKYQQNQPGTANTVSTMLAFHKTHFGNTFAAFHHTVAVADGTMGPRQDDPVYTVFEVRMDGGVHPEAWSRLPTVGAWKNWDQGRSLAVRIEWEHPPNSGQWNYTYLKTDDVAEFWDDKTPGSNNNYVKTIALIRWLMNSTYVDPQNWMPELEGCANVLQTVYDCHNQTIQVQIPKSFTMCSGARRSVENIASQMRSLGLQNVNVPRPSASIMKDRSVCDTCVLLDGSTKPRLGLDCTEINNTHLCKVCLLFGRPCCSYTLDVGGFGPPAHFSEASIQGTDPEMLSFEISADDVNLNNKWLSALIIQPLKPKLVKTSSNS